MAVAVTSLTVNYHNLCFRSGLLLKIQGWHVIFSCKVKESITSPSKSPRHFVKIPHFTNCGCKSLNKVKLAKPINIRTYFFIFTSSKAVGDAHEIKFYLINFRFPLSVTFINHGLLKVFLQSKNHC